MSTINKAPALDRGGPRRTSKRARELHSAAGGRGQRGPLGNEETYVPLSLESITTPRCDRAGSAVARIGSIEGCLVPDLRTSYARALLTARPA
ncbi:hypothetical protein EVAR_51025_1 [Eumeta japonica]|uniref:Uncharacterized protein n=1 Tax=Eumeta variegata TaxID=151549 RepID=A0A4C1Y4B3_EUMVA|nr:hypothetical protein EVAR_51025_1 [Eumeta japonica]